MSKKENIQQEIVDLYSHLDNAWQLYLDGKVTEAVTLFSDSKNHFLIQKINSKIKAQNSKLTQKQVLDRLLKYDHPFFQGMDSSLHLLLSLAIVRSLRKEYFYTDDPVQEFYKEYYHCVDPLAVIIGSEFIFQMDIAKVASETYSNLYKVPTEGIENPWLPINYEERQKLFPELALLTNMSFHARKGFIGVIIYLQEQSGFVESGKIFSFDQSCKCIEGIDELVDAKLLDKNPEQVDLLMFFTLKELKQYALEKGLEAHGTKYQIAQLIVENIDIDMINTLIFSKTEGKQFLRPKIENLPLLKKYIWAEITKISLYINWLDRFYSKRIPPRVYSDREIQQLDQTANEYKQQRNMSLSPPDYGLVSEGRYIEYINDPKFDMERKYVSELWDNACDEIVDVLADKYAWYVYSHYTWLVSDAIAAYLPSETLAAFQKKFEKLYKYAWRDALANYGSMRLYQMGKKMRAPRLLLCPGCGEEFIESSVGGYYAKKVNYNIGFCNDCYRIVCLHSTCAKLLDLNDEEMLELLKILCIEMDSIPTIRFMKAPTFNTFNEQKQIEIIKHMLKMPSIKQYEKRFGSWTQSLIMSGALGSDLLYRGRGYECVALDGHVCNSLAEKVIDDWLYNHQIEHEKEPLYPYDFYLNPSGKLRGDWQVRNMIIEYAGLDHPEYQAKIKAKEEIAKKYRLNLIIVEPKDMIALESKLGGLLVNCHYQPRLFD